MIRTCKATVWLAALGVLVLGTPAHAAFAFVEQTTVNSTAATTNTRTITIASGNIIVCWTGNRTAATLPTGIADDVNGAWNLANGRGNAFGTAAISQGIYYFPNSASGSVTITVTYAGSVTNLFKCAEFSTATPTGVTLETSNDADNTTTTTHGHGSISTAGTGLLLTGATADASLTETANANFTALSDDGLRMWTQYRIETGSFSGDGAFTTSTSGQTAGVILALKEASASGALLRRRRGN